MFKWFITKAIRAELAELDHEIKKATNRIESLEISRSSAVGRLARARAKKEAEAEPERISHNRIFDNPEVQSFIGMLPPEEREAFLSRISSERDGDISESTDDSEENR